MTEADARELLRNRSSFDLIEGWMAEQPWQAAPAGWTGTSKLQGWRLRVEVIAKGLRITARPPSGSPAVWIVASRS